MTVQMSSPAQPAAPQQGDQMQQGQAQPKPQPQPQQQAQQPGDGKPPRFNDWAML